MGRGYSPAARKNAAIARKIKNRLGVSAYNQFKTTGKVPAGLDSAPTQSQKKKQSGGGFADGKKRVGRLISGAVI